MSPQAWTLPRSSTVGRVVSRAVWRRPWLAAHDEDLRQECAIALWLQAPRLAVAEQRGDLDARRCVGWICSNAIASYEAAEFGMSRTPSKYSEDRRAVRGFKLDIDNEAPEFAFNLALWVARKITAERVAEAANCILGPKQIRALNAAEPGDRLRHQALERLAEHFAGADPAVVLARWVKCLGFVDESEVSDIVERRYCAGLIDLAVRRGLVRRSRRKQRWATPRPRRGWEWVPILRPTTLLGGAT